MKGTIFQIAAILSLASSIHAGPVGKLVGSVVGGIVHRDVYENDVGSLFRRYPGEYRPFIGESRSKLI